MSLLKGLAAYTSPAVETKAQSGAENATVPGAFFARAEAEANLVALRRKTLGLWEPYMASDQPTTTGSEHVVPSLRIRGPVAFIGLSSARPSPPFMAVGSLGKTQLKRLAELLEQARQQKLFRVVMVHHAPIPASDKWRKRLTDSADLCRVLSKHGVELVL